MGTSDQLPNNPVRRCAMKPPLRTKLVGTKVSEAEFALLEERARGAEMRLAQWVREALLKPRRVSSGTFNFRQGSGAVGDAALQEDSPLSSPNNLCLEQEFEAFCKSCRAQRRTLRTPSRLFAS